MLDGTEGLPSFFESVVSFLILFIDSHITRDTWGIAACRLLSDGDTEVVTVASLMQNMMGGTMPALVECVHLSCFLLDA